MIAHDVCPTCRSEMEWVLCEDCGGDGIHDHDCGEDTCPCADPEPNVRCTTCLGAGGWLRCFNCHPLSDAEREALTF